MVTYPLEHGRAVLENFRDFMLRAPDEAAAGGALLYSPDGDPVCAVLMAYIGPLEEGERVLRPLHEFGSPLTCDVGPTDYLALQKILDEAFPAGWGNLWKASFMNELPDDAIDTAIQGFADAPSPLSLVLFEPFGGALARVPPDATAFGARTFPFDVLIRATWAEQGEAARHTKWAHRIWRAMQPFVVPEVYVNYLSAEESARTSDAYGSNYDRLVVLKKRYDPDNFFKSNQNIAPAP